MRPTRTVLTAGLLTIALAPWASAASYVVDNFAAPATAAGYSLVGLGTLFSGLVPGSLPTNLNVVSDVNPLNALTTTSYGGGALTLTSPSLGRAYAQVGYGAYAAGSPMSVDTTSYNYFELSFARANEVLNINAELYSASPTGPLIYYDANGVNVAPAPGNKPFDVFIAIPSPAGFNRADVNGIFFEIDVANNTLGSSWAINNFALTTSAPEPAAWTILLVGAGGLGAVTRRGRRGNRPASSAV